MKNPQIFVKRLSLDIPVQDAFSWHENQGALERLSPPWAPLSVVHHTGGIQSGAHVSLRLPLTPLPIKMNWEAIHTDYLKNSVFKDRQVKGPFSFWEHTHRFIPEKSDRCIIEDRVKFMLPIHTITKYCFSTVIKKELNRIFTYRHSTLMADLKDHQKYKTLPRLNILISGSGGVIGSALIPFLTTGGHRVFRLVRRKPNPLSDEFFWDPHAGKLDLNKIDRIDAVIHLSGENIGNGRWTVEKKRKIIDSRKKSTTLLSKAIASLDDPPDVFICASAIGFYGDRGHDEITEENTCGDAFISGVCSDWEQSAKPAREMGIRCVFLRIGVVLSPQGGALKRLLLPFKLGMGAKIGSGGQYISWIGIDDVVGAIYHIIYHNTIDGPINITSPKPVTNIEFTKTLGRILNRPSWFKIPEAIIKLNFGEMGKEILLSSTRVIPKKMLENGYEFRYPDLKSALGHLLGKIER